MWSREEDFGHDQYRPMGLVRVRMGMDADGTVRSYANRIVTPSPLYQRGWIPATGNDNVDGAVGLPYAFQNRLVEYVLHQASVPVGFWRSVGESINCFAVESAIDEAALLVGKDPLAFRQDLLVGNQRHLAVLNAATSMIAWSTPPPAGSARGLALGTGFGSIAALAVEVSQPTAGTMAVNRVACAIDCGIAVNPGQIKPNCRERSSRASARRCGARPPSRTASRAAGTSRTHQADQDPRDPDHPGTGDPEWPRQPRWRR